MLSALCMTTLFVIAPINRKEGLSGLALYSLGYSSGVDWTDTPLSCSIKLKFQVQHVYTAD